MSFKIQRKITKAVRIGAVTIGAQHPIAIQSMIKLPTKNVAAVLEQARQLHKRGCEIIRVAVKDSQDAAAIRQLKKHIRMPLVADIHFNYLFALQAIDAGVDKIRLNPGNIFKAQQVREVAKAARQRHIPIRIGVNSGSLREKYSRGKNNVEALVRQTKDYVAMLEDFGTRDIVISLKSSDIFETIQAYRKISALYRYPLHLGVTATGLFNDGIIKSSLGIGTLLMEGIGDTIRVSLLGNPIEEIDAAKGILSSLCMRRFGPNFICCPTCGRCEVDLQKEANKLASRLQQHNGKGLSHLTIALMGCMVNGPGEAKHADIGLAFGKSRGLLFKKGKIIETVDYARCIDTLIRHL